ncbi:hypothetical protein WCX49_05250 [Sulfurimonas sp. HSL-1656]|uniref:hypothetical protein n=1 Tax=Thiomicrolovo subterrani TaxID=3131934 RepID=UPI0031F8CC4A
MNPHDLDDLKAEFDKFVREKCSTDESGNPVENERDAGDAVDDEPVPAFVDELENKLLAPALSGVYLSRIDIKRISQALDESLPIKERKKMVKALFRHTNSKAWLRGAFDEINNHINGRILIYRELSETFPATAPIFSEHIAKAEKTKKMFDQIVDDFEEIEPTDEPMMV